MKNRNFRNYLAYSASASVGLAMVLFGQNTHSALLDITQTTQKQPVLVGAMIAKSLAEQIGTGHGDINTPGSSLYLIKRDPARAVRRGRQLFQRKFTHNQGLGPRVNNDSVGDLTTNTALGAGLAESCSSCHSRPRGSAGFGGDGNTRPDSRDAPHLFGLGLVEMIADEITSDLRAIRSQAISQAKNTATTVKLELVSKGIKFGFIQASATGVVDTSMVDGIDADLRVRPLAAHGKDFSIRAFVNVAYKDIMGIEPVDPLVCQATDPANPQRVVTPAGLILDPSLDKITRPPACSTNEDPDGDGVKNELDYALVDYMEFYLLNYFKPAIGQVTPNVLAGLDSMNKVGCTSCHIQNIQINNDRRIADVETNFDPEKGIFNRLFATATPRVKVENDGQSIPLILPENKSFLVQNIFADFKRHNLGPNFHERQYDGSIATKFVTEPLWGVGTTRTYGHDGRSINLKEVILRHGGEAKEQRDKFAALTDEQQNQVIEALSALVLFPPDDTASNLNPGKPKTANPQDPAEHGSISLSPLFQITSEGKE